MPSVSRGRLLSVYHSYYFSIGFYFYVFSLWRLEILKHQFKERLGKREGVLGIAWTAARYLRNSYVQQQIWLPRKDFGEYQEKHLQDLLSRGTIFCWKEAKPPRLEKSFK